MARISLAKAAEREFNRSPAAAPAVRDRYNRPVDPNGNLMVGGTTYTADTINIQTVGMGANDFQFSDARMARPPEPERLSDREWLDAQVDEICELAS